MYDIRNLYVQGHSKITSGFTLDNHVRRYVIIFDRPWFLYFEVDQRKQTSPHHVYRWSTKQIHIRYVALPCLTAERKDKEARVLVCKVYRSSYADKGYLFTY